VKERRSRRRILEISEEKAITDNVCPSVSVALVEIRKRVEKRRRMMCMNCTYTVALSINPRKPHFGMA